MLTFFRLLLAIFFVVAGGNHFVSPEFYVGITPEWIRYRHEVVVFSGIAEILGALGVLIPRTRKWAGWGLVLLLLAIMPVHLQMAFHGFRNAPAWLLWLRIPFQGVLIAWVWLVAIR